MTTTKEDQIRAEFRKLHPNSEMQEQFREGWKACAESYEERLAENKEAFELVKRLHIKALSDLVDARGQLSEANARNAMLVEVLKRASTSLRAFCSDEGWAQADMDTMDSVDWAVSANSEAVAAWEAEKLKPLRREVTMLRSVLIRTAMDLKNSDNYDEALLDAAVNDTQATAEAYEREVTAKALEKSAKVAHEFWADSDIGICQEIERKLINMAAELHTNKVKEE